MAEKFSGKLEYGGEGGEEERRRAPRFEKTFDLTFRVKSLPDADTLKDTLDRLLTAQSRDVSAVGISMWTSKMLVPGTTIELEFPLPSGGDAITATARVVWCQPHTEGGYVRSRMGLDFVDMSPEAREKLNSLLNA